MITLEERFIGCLLGGAVGDSLGSNVEFMKNEEIKEQYGESGITDMVESDGLYKITDDTQMTMFTAEGILLNKNPENIIQDMYESYLRWFNTQFGPNAIDDNLAHVGGLYKIEELYEMRMPGHACISSLRSGRMGTVDNPINISKGSGTVMRTAPIGLSFKDPFKIARDCAAITHGHEYAHICAGFLAVLIQEIIQESTINIAMEKAKEMTEEYYSLDEGIYWKIRNWCSPKLNDIIIPIFLIGEGWLAEDALAISVYASKMHDTDFRKAIIYAVNHSGDSDTTGAITGNILGAYLGVNAIPEEWLDKLEFKKELTDLAIGLAKNMEMSNIS